MEWLSHQFNNNCNIIKFDILGGDREPRGNTEETKLQRKENQIVSHRDTEVKSEKGLVEAWSEKKPAVS